VGKTERKRLLVSPGPRWDDNIKMDFQDVGCGLDWLIWLRTGTSDGLL